MLTKRGLFVLLILTSAVCSTHQSEEAKFLKSETVVNYPTSTGNTKENITIGFLTSFREGVGKIISGAIPLAVEFVNNKYLPNHKVDFITADIPRTNSSLGIKSMLRLNKSGVHAFIGPEQNCVSEALLASALNLPMITYKCADKVTSDKKIYTTFARTLPPASKISISITALLRHFQWDKVVLIVADSATDLQIKDALVHDFQNYSISITETFFIKAPYLSRDNQTLQRIVEESCEKTRIYVLITEIHAAMDVVRLLYKVKGKQISDYALVAVEDEEFYDPLKKLQFFFKIFADEYLSVDVLQRYNVFEQVFKTLLMLTPTGPTNPNFKKFSEHVTNKTREVFSVPFHPQIMPQVPLYAGLAYDAVVVYAKALNKTLEEGGNPRDGEHIMRNILSQSYESILGFDDRIDLNGDADGNYTLLSLNKSSNYNDTPTMAPIGIFKKVENSNLPELHLTAKIDWFNEDGEPPKAEPKCGFNNEKCAFRIGLIAIIASSVCIFIFISLYFLFLYFRYELKLASKLWKVNLSEVMILNLGKNQTSQDVKNEIAKFKREADSQYAINIQLKNSFLEGKDGIGFYRGSIIFISKVHRRTVDVTRAMCKELIQLHEMRNENINPFIGISLEPSNICVFTMYCARGSLEDVLRNEDLKMDYMFVASLVADLVKGLIYLHYSENISHGNLKSSNCLVDSRWVLQITGFGLDEFRQPSPAKLVTKKHKASLLWKPPEVLRKIRLELGDSVFNSNLLLKSEGLNAKRKADIYSFGIILYEIVGRKGPWGTILNQRELQPEHSYFRASSNLIKKRRFFTLGDNEGGFDDEPHIQRSFSDSISSNKFLKAENGLLKADDNAEVSSICLGLEFKKDLLTQNSLTTYDYRLKANNLRSKDYEWPISKQVAVVRPKEHSVCLIDDYDQGRKLNQMRRKAIDSLLSSKKSLDERGNNNHLKNLNGKFKIEDIVDRVKNPSKYSNAIFRPNILALKDCPQYLSNAIRLCWAEKPEARPDMKQVNSMLRQLQSGLKSNIFDNMISMLEKHANNLEALVEERTKQLVEEKKKTETLLLRMLPKPVADQLKRGQKVKAEAYENVTVYFSDIVGFTELSFQSTPFQVVTLLNDLYTCFDEIIGNYDVYKVETIGDAYMVVSGISSIIKEVSKRHHSVEIAMMALHLLDVIRNFTIKHRPQDKLKLRIGIHSGPVVGGVVGLKMPRYCLFGDTVNTASRMESTGEALKIHISENFKKNLDQHGDFVIEPRGMTYVKGIGNMQTYFLLGMKKEN